jgi:hypothetical protein
MTATALRESLGDIASRFPILPHRLANALDVYGSDTKARAWIADGRLLKLEVEDD